MWSSLPLKQIAKHPKLNFNSKITPQPCYRPTQNRFLQFSTMELISLALSCATTQNTLCYHNSSITQNKNIVTSSYIWLFLLKVIDCVAPTGWSFIKICAYTCLFWLCVEVCACLRDYLPLLCAYSQFLCTKFIFFCMLCIPWVEHMSLMHVWHCFGIVLIIPTFLCAFGLVSCIFLYCLVACSSLFRAHSIPFLHMFLNCLASVCILLF